VTETQRLPNLKRGYLVKSVADALGKTPQALKKQLERETVRGWGPHTHNNPLDHWVIDADALDAEHPDLKLEPCIWLKADDPPLAPGGIDGSVDLGATELEDAQLHRQFAEAENLQLRDEVLELTKREAAAQLAAETSRADIAEAESGRLKLVVAHLSAALTGIPLEAG
jgi:hypothetical protein